MDQKKLREWEARCTQEEPPACQAGCPLGLDVRGFNKAMTTGKLDDARRLLDKSLPLAEIVARLCEGPCQNYCLRSELGGSIEIPKLEQYCIEKTRAKIKILPLPAKAKTAAIIGSGPSSLTVAFELARKGYPATIFYLEQSFGSWLSNLSEEKLPKKILEESKTILIKLGVKFIALETLSANLLDENYDSFFIGQDDLLDQTLKDKINSLSTLDPITQELENGIFSIAVGNDDNKFINSVSQGRQAAISMDRYLQGASLTASRVSLRNGETTLYVNTSEITPNQTTPSIADKYNAEEAQLEATRCINCQCLECVKKCTFLKEFGSYPKVYVRRIYNNSAIVKGNHQANKFINSCSLCGQCEEICPNDFSMAKVCLEARQMMVEDDRMPPSAGAFAISEMHSAKDEAYLFAQAKNVATSSVVFFPGCQLAGIRPKQTKKLFIKLQEINPETGIWLDCCSAPAHWGGDKHTFSNFISKSKKQWQEMGCPTIITACTSCTEIFRNNIPEMNIVPVWQLLSDNNVKGKSLPTPLAVSDPCTARHDSATLKSVRKLMSQLGQEIEELPSSGKLTECCGFGGLMESTNEEISTKVVDNRGKQTDLPILTYCAMCRDQLAKSGKPVYHLLDLLFPGSENNSVSHEKPISISKRRQNRRDLQQEMLTILGSGKIIERPVWETIQIHIPTEVAVILESRRILEDDIKQVIQLNIIEGNGSHVCHADGKTIIANQVLGKVTFWLQYHIEEDVYHIKSCWSHRMSINEVTYES